jgi:hypothetical protein
MTCNTSPAIEQCKIGHSTNSINNVRIGVFAGWLGMRRTARTMGIAAQSRICAIREPNIASRQPIARLSATAGNPAVTHLGALDASAVQDLQDVPITSTLNFEIITTSAIEEEQARRLPEGAQPRAGTTFAICQARQNRIAPRRTETTNASPSKVGPRQKFAKYSNIAPMSYQRRSCQYISMANSMNTAAAGRIR